MLTEDEFAQTGEQSSTRARKYTENGLEWQISQTERNLRTSIAYWRTNATKISKLLSDCSDVGTNKNKAVSTGRPHV